MHYCTYTMAETNFCFAQRRFAHDHVRNCYPAFNKQFDVLHAEAVIWEPYMEEAVHAKYPGGISLLCTRDHVYWMTKSKIIFNVSVEEMAQQSIMRQYGLRQIVVHPPTEDPCHHSSTRMSIYTMFDCLSQLVVFKLYLIVQHTTFLGCQGRELTGPR